MAKAKVDFGGISKSIHMACIPDAKIGDYVLVHAGVALTVVDEQAARQLLDDLKMVSASDETS